MWLSANGGGGDDAEWYIGRDWHTWARRGLIDFYVPQLYTKDVEHFTKAGAGDEGMSGRVRPGHRDGRQLERDLIRRGSRPK